MKYDLERIKVELNKLPKFDNQIYLQCTSKDMDPIEPTTGKNYLIVYETEKKYNVPYVPKTSVIEKEPEWSIGKGPKFANFKMGWDKN